MLQGNLLPMAGITKEKKTFHLSADGIYNIFFSASSLFMSDQFTEGEMSA